MSARENRRRDLSPANAESILREALKKLAKTIPGKASRRDLSVGAQQLLVVAGTIPFLDQKRARRKPWLGFEAVDRAFPDLELIKTVTEFVSTSCYHLRAPMKPNRVSWYEEEDNSRFRELIAAEKSDRLIHTLHRSDCDLLSNYCSLELAELCSKDAGRGSAGAWKIRAVAMYYDVICRHRGRGVALWGLFEPLRDFVWQTENIDLLQKLNSCAPRAVNLSLAEIKKERQKRTHRDGERKRRASLRTEASGELP